MNLLYIIIFSPASTFCAQNFFENRSSPNTFLIEENTNLAPSSTLEFFPTDHSNIIIKLEGMMNFDSFDEVKKKEDFRILYGLRTSMLASFLDFFKIEPHRLYDKCSYCRFHIYCQMLEIIKQFRRDDHCSFSFI